MTMTINPAVSLNLLTEISRFFGTQDTLIRELLQNSLRAGATQVHVTSSDTSLSFEDDGRGLDNPQVLLTAAESGWGDEVTEPAGLGLMSSFNSDWVSRIEIESRFGTFSLSPQDFAAARPVTVLPSPARDGFRITLTLTAPIDVQRLLKQNRGYAPAHITLNGAAVPRFEYGEGLPCRTGTVHFETDPLHSNALDHAIYGVWEHFSLDASLLKREVLDQGDALSASLVWKNFTLMIDPASGLRPKLPDRRSLAQNPALTLAATDLVEVLQQEAERRIRAAITDLGTETLRHDTVTTAKHQTDASAVAAFLSREGYAQLTTSTRLEDAQFTRYDEEYADDDHQAPTFTVWMKPQAGDVWDGAQNDEEDRISPVLTHELLRQQGVQVPRVFTPHAEFSGPELSGSSDLEVITGVIGGSYDLDYGDKREFIFGFTDALSVGGMSVPFYTDVSGLDGSGQEINVKLLLAGTPARTEALTAALGMELGGLLICHEPLCRSVVESEYVDNDGKTDTCLTPGVLRTLLGESVLKVLFPDRARGAKEIGELRKQADKLSRAEQILLTFEQTGEPFGDMAVRVGAARLARQDQIKQLKQRHNL